MRAFARLLERLAFTPARNAKLTILRHYLERTPDPDRGYALAALTGDLKLRAVTPSLLRGLVAERVDAGAMARAPVLVWRNATRVRLINAFRVAYGAPEEALVPGEPLICDGIELPLKHRK